MMKPALAFLIVAAGLSAQPRDNRDKALSCDTDRPQDRERFRTCKMSEQTLAPVGRLSIGGGHNGGIRVRGWSQNRVLVRARVEAWAPSESESSLLAGQVHLELSAGTVRASGPQHLEENRGWSVSWEVFTPNATELKTETHNGGIDVSDIRGRVNATTHNGGINVSRVTGEVDCTTHNGGINVSMAQTVPGPLRLETHNGGVQLHLPQNASARVHAETHNGAVQSDYAMPANRSDERSRGRNVDFAIGSGGPAISIKTYNGGIQVRKL